ncbi:endonuclease III [Clostridium sp.]|uniref:endonuclease III n=1 Tax=Clostridium sp. TaxID=1506 RepID=UPI001A3DF1C2|nr:endonuclease III [Clostridium sp.]MBK5240749.1 endonuclease III [Clostridium sp.]
MKYKELWNFTILTVKCFIILLAMGILMPKAVDFLLHNLINNTEIYKNSIAVYKLVDLNYKLVYNYILKFYLFFRV